MGGASLRRDMRLSLLSWRKGRTFLCKKVKESAFPQQSREFVVILIYLGSNSRSVSTVLYSFSIPVPFSGGRISKEKAVLSVLFIKSTTLIVLSRSLMPYRAELHIWAKIRKIS